MRGVARPPKKLSRLDKRAVNAVVQSQFFDKICWGLGWPGEIDVHVGCAGHFLIGNANEVLLADILDSGDFTFYVGDNFFNAIDDLINGLFFAPIIEDEGSAVIAVCGFHFESLRLS
jgi:hypothetical protein